MAEVKKMDLLAIGKQIADRRAELLKARAPIDKELEELNSMVRLIAPETRGREKGSRVIDGKYRTAAEVKEIEVARATAKTFPQAASVGK